MSLLRLIAAAVLSLLPLSAIAQGCPDWQLVAPKTIEASAESLYQQYQTPMIAGGDIHLTSCPQVPGIGYLAKAPDLSLQYDDAGQGRLLDLRVQADCDTTLLVNLPDGQYIFADDEDGMNPVIRIQAADGGLYDIWVGTIDAANCASILQIETF